MIWLLPANLKTYDHVKAFEENEYIDWRQGRGKFEVGDRVFLYCAKPIMRVEFECIVQKVGMEFSEVREDQEYWLNEDEYKKSKEGKFFRLQLVRQLNSPSLSLSNLKLNGLRSAPQGAMRVSDKLAKYIDSQFDASPGWSTEELKASVGSYLEMLSSHREGRKIVKKRVYAELAKKFGRTEKAFEYRMQNISRVLDLLGREWLPGLAPARNIGERVTSEIERILASFEGCEYTDRAAFEGRVRASQRKKSSGRRKPSGNRNPKSRTSNSTTYVRDPKVVDWVLNEANGVCESCGENSPFLNSDGLPFLEVHHVQQLADSGPDVVENAVALCPNCHRALHFSKDRHARKQDLYINVDRLNNK
jgi:hypothetical protein